MGRGIFGAVVLGLLAGGAGAQTAAPSATTATFGSWTVGCGLMAQAETQARCEMTTRLSLKGQDGQTRPLLTWTIGTPPGGAGQRMAVQVPGNVALRAGVVISTDHGKAPAEGAADLPQDVLATLSFVTCTPQGCLADADATPDMMARLKTARSANVSFTLMQGGRVIRVPVSLDGFGDAMATLAAGGK